MHPQPDLPTLSSAALRALREDQPSDRELATAYARFTRPARRRSPGLIVSRWLIAGLVAGLGVAFGSEAIVQYLQPALPAPPAAPVATARAARKRTPRSAPLPTQPEAPEAPAAEPLLPLPELKAPRATSSVGPKASSVALDDRPPADSAVWAKAAEGLRTNDIAETQSALATLEEAASAADREAARLIRAQLMLHQGNTSGARALLLDLANHAQSAAVRTKARSLLAAKSNSVLSVPPSGT